MASNLTFWSQMDVKWKTDICWYTKVGQKVGVTQQSVIGIHNLFEHIIVSLVDGRISCLRLLCVLYCPEATGCGEVEVPHNHHVHTCTRKFNEFGNGREYSHTTRFNSMQTFLSMENMPY